jgi:hypothetical protein
MYLPSVPFKMYAGMIRFLSSLYKLDILHNFPLDAIKCSPLTFISSCCPFVIQLQKAQILKVGGERSERNKNGGGRKEQGKEKREYHE